MKINPMTDAEEAAEKAKFGAWPKGAYDFEVAGAEDSTSKKGNEMIVLDLMVFDRNGTRRNMKDWLVESLPVKLKQACEATGLHAAYANGNVTSYDFVGRTGRLMLGIEKQEGYEDRNKVTGYVPVTAVTPATRPAVASARQTAPARKPVPAGANSDLDDEIPF
jgi:Protein of unknown function (DUF669)